MSGLLDIVTGALDGIDVDGAIGGEVGNLTNIADTVSQLSQGQPLELDSFVQSIAEMDLPVFDFADDIINQVAQVRDIIPTDIGDILGPVTQALGKIEGSLGEGITDLVGPFVTAFDAINTLIHTDFSFGASADGGGGTPAIPRSIVSSDPSTQIDTTKLAAFGNAMDELPADASVGSLLEWFNDTISIDPTSPINAAFRSIPFLDDIREPLETVLEWAAMSQGDFQTQIINTLQTLAQAIQAQTTQWLEAQFQELNDIISALNLTELRQVVEDIQTRLDELRGLIDTDAITDAVLTEIEAAIAALILQRDALAQAFVDDVKAELENKLKIIAVVPIMLEEKMSSLIMLLQPPAGISNAGASEPFPPGIPEATAFAGLEGFLDQYTEVFENLMNALDISEITEAFEAPTEAIDDAVEEIDQAVTMVTLEITNRLSQVQNLIASLDLPGIVDNAEQAVEDFSDSVVGTLTDTFTPVRDSIEAVTTQISAVVTTFNPAAVVATIEQGIDSVAAELQAPEIVDALAVMEKLKSIAERLDRLSFTPVADEVVGTIDGMTTAVAGVGSNLDDPLLGLLKGALGVLPDSLEPVTDPLVEGIGTVINAGPLPLLEAIKDVPQTIVDAINDFNPGELIGDSLSGPFQDLITELEALDPGMILDPINDEIENLKTRLRENAQPGQLFDPLIEVHEQILTDLEGFNPGEIIDPINEALTEATATIASSIPLDDVFDGIETVINDIQRILGADGVADSIIDLIQRFREYLTPFVEATENISDQIQEWLGESLAVVDDIDISTMQSAFESVTDAIDSVQSEAIQLIYDNAVVPINTALTEQLQPGALMTSLVKSHSDCRTAWNGLADSIDKARIDSILLSVNPTAPDLAEVFTAYGRVITVLSDTQSGLETTLATWDETFHQVDGVLASYREVPASPEELKQWLIDSLDNRLISPLQSLFEKFAPTATLLDAFIAPIVDLVTALRDTVNGIIAAPAALLAVGDSLQAVLDRIESINLDFISDSIDDIFDEVKDQFRGLDPRGLKLAVNESFEDILNVISLDQIVPLDALDQADADINAALEGLRQLDPQVLITDVIQPKFEEALAPFVSALDLTPSIELLIARLQPIEAELGTEMDRVNSSYQGFKNSVPA